MKYNVLHVHCRHYNAHDVNSGRILSINGKIKFLFIKRKNRNNDEIEIHIIDNLNFSNQDYLLGI